MAEYPHCSMRILHRPGACTFCDGFPKLQKLREVWNVNYTGESDPAKSPCPELAFRSLDTAYRWPGNRPFLEEVLEVQDEDLIEDDEDTLPIIKLSERPKV